MQLSFSKNDYSKKNSAIRAGFRALIIFGTALTISAAPATSVAQSASQSFESLALIGTTTIHSTPLGSGAVQNPEIDVRGQDSSGTADNAAIAALVLPATSAAWRQSNRPIPGKEAARAHVTAMLAGASPSLSLPLPEPVVNGDTVVHSQASGFLGFEGLSHIDQRLANGGNQFSLEPPDQGLCAGRGFVVETINNAIRVFDTHGNALAGVEDMNSFFGLVAAIDRTTGIVGPFLADPRCYYDRETGHWFVTELVQDNGTNAGATNRNFNLIAVSKTTDPTGAFAVFSYDVTDDGLNGTPNHPGCPCFGDQPLFGADTYGVYQSTNEFGAGFNGAQVYAISKSALIAAAESFSAPLPVVVAINAGPALVPFGGTSYSIQPATSPNNGSESEPGVEYFLSALQFGNPGYEVYDNRIAVWALTNTQSLHSRRPNVSLSFSVINSETYGQPDPASQMAGDTPLAATVGDGLEVLNTNDDRMNQVVYAGGLLYSGVNSKLSVGGASQTGIAWFAVSPSLHGHNVSGHVVNQGYVALAGNNALFPSLGITHEGNGVMAFSVSGDAHFPSAGYVVVNEGEVSHSVHIAGAGQDSEDGFSGYPQIAFGVPSPVPPPYVARWGDYSAAVADGDQVWFASEYIPNACAALTLPCRTLNANWGTFVAKIAP